MEDVIQQGGDRGNSPEGEIHVVPDNLREQPLPAKDERTVSSNTSLGAAITGPSRIVTDQPESLDSTGPRSTVFPPGAYSPGAYSPSDQIYYFGASGYDNSTGHWGDYSNYVNANNLQILPSAMYSDNPSLLLHPGYGFDTQVAYGQFSPLANPLSPVMVDGQLYSPHQFPMSPNYYPQSVSPSMPHVSSGFLNSQTGMRTQGNSGQEGLNENTVIGPGSGYYVHFGSFDGELLSNQSNPSDMGNYMSPLTSGVYPQPVGILGPYEHNIGQASQQHTPFHGYEFASGNSTRRYPHNGSYQNSNYSSGPISHWEANRLKRFTPDKGGTRERERDSISISAVSRGISSERNRGPRASKPKGKNTEEISAPGVGKNGPSTSGVILDLYNQPDFVTNYENAKFFVIKSFSEDNVHKSIKYSVWASTPLGNRKLDAAYHQAKEMKDDCPVFLFFSVNASGQFCGVAEMIGPVDFENDADYWQQDRWSGQFPVKWHIIKDVSNSRFRHILLENNDNKPVTHSRDCQEVKVEQGNEMLKIFKEHAADTSLLDDFNYYDEREKGLRENKALDASTINENLSTNFSDSLKLDDTTSSNKQVLPLHKTE